MNPARHLLLAASANRWLRERASRAAFVRRSVARFMPGERLDDALAAAARLRDEGIGVILTELGENSADVDEADQAAAHCLEAMERAWAAGLDAHVSVKPTQLGLGLDPDRCARLLERLAERGRDLGCFVWIDMESSPFVDATLDLFRRVRARSALVGVALQASLRRSERDLKALLPLGGGIRLVKGAYLEPRGVAFQSKSDVDRNYLRLAVRAMDLQRPDGVLHLATHDRAIIDRLRAELASRGGRRPRCEFAMLYGVQQPLQERLAREGLPVRVLISYGERWFPWYMRRLAERPANVWFVIGNLVGRPWR